MFNQEKISRAVNLDPLPGYVTRLIALTASGKEDDIDEVAKIIASHEPFAADVLRWANAVSSSFEPLKTLDEAVTGLGKGLISGLALGREARRYMRSQPSFSGYLISDLWRHSVATMFAVAQLKKASNQRISDMAFAAALFHDAGKVVLSQFLSPEQVRLLWRATIEGGISPVEAESKILKFNHSEAGALLAQSWALPEEVARAIYHHHQPDIAGDSLCDAVCVANHLTKIRISRAAQEMLLRSLHRLGFTEQQYLSLQWKLADCFENNYERFCNATCQLGASPLYRHRARVGQVNPLGFA